MPFTIQAKTLAEIIGIAAKVCGGRSTIPIAECVRLRFAGDQIKASTTNFENWITIANGDVVLKDKECETAIIPCAQFLSIISALPSDQEVELSTTKNRLTVKSGKSKYNFGLLDEEWPEPKPEKDVKFFSMDSDGLLESLKFVQSNVAVEDTRPFLCGVGLRTIGAKSLRFMASNAHAASLKVVEFDNQPVLPENGVIIPTKLVGFIVDLLSKTNDFNTTAGFTESKAYFDFKGSYQISLVGRLIDGQFPDMDRVIPYARDSVAVKFSRQQMIDNLRRVDSMCDQKTRAVKLTFQDGQIFISAKGGQNDGEEVMESDQDKLIGSIGFNSRLLVGLLLSLDCATVTVLLDKNDIDRGIMLITDGKTSLSPDKDTFSVLMPMRI